MFLYDIVSPLTVAEAKGLAQASPSANTPQAQAAAKALQAGILKTKEQYPGLDAAFDAAIIKEIQPDGTVVVHGGNGTARITRLMALGGGAQFKVVADQGVAEGLNEFAADGGGGSGDYFQALASAWYNGTFDTGSLQKGIKSQQDVERLLNRGIVCPDGVTRKFGIDYNSDFDGVVISSDDYYEHADHDETDSRTGKPFGPYDYMEFGDEELDESAKYRDPKYKGQLYTQEPPDYMDTREYDRAMFDPKPDNYPGRKELPGGGEYDRTDPLVRGAGIGRSGIKNNILDRGKRKGLPSRDQITSLKQSIRDISGRHTRANLPEQGVAEGLNDTIYPNAEVIKSRNGKPVGEIYQDENGWGCFHYKADNGADGMSDREEALAQLKDMHNERRPQGVAEGGYNDYDNNRKGFSRPGREDDEYHVPDPVEPQYNIKVNGQVINQQPFANRSEALTWAKRAVAAGKLDPKNATLSPINQVNELSNDKLASYKKAAGADATAADKRGDFEHGNKRFRGIVKATIKQGDNDAKKHKVNELSKDKLSNYVKANANDQVQHASSQSFVSGKNGDKYNKADAWDKRTTNRERGMDRALNKLSKATESVDYLSKLKNERNRKLNSLVNELLESIKNEI